MTHTTCEVCFVHCKENITIKIINNKAVGNIPNVKNVLLKLLERLSIPLRGNLPLSGNSAYSLFIASK